MNKYVTSLVLLVLVVSLCSPLATARPAYLDAFNHQYGTEDTKLDACITCHISPAGGGPRNPYGSAYSASDRDLVSIETLDSDGDGFTNLEEINALTFPGNPDDYPQTTSELPPEAESGDTDMTDEQSTEEPISDPAPEQQSPGFGVAFAIAGLLSSIYLMKKYEQ